MILYSLYASGHETDLILGRVERCYTVCMQQDWGQNVDLLMIGEILYCSYAAGLQTPNGSLGNKF